MVYKIPSQPSRLRLQVWRKLQAIGAVYLQDAVCALPSGTEHEKEFTEVAESIREMGGIVTLFHAVPLGEHEDDAVLSGFRKSADERYKTILSRIDTALELLQTDVDMVDIEVAEESLMRERIAFLRAKKIAYFGGTFETLVEEKLESLRLQLDEIRDAILA
jgi:hypothetical protein